jgi:hypothetical protein
MLFLWPFVYFIPNPSRAERDLSKRLDEQFRIGAIRKKEEEK